MTRCVFCQGESPNDSHFCRHCGRPLYPMKSDSESGNSSSVNVQPFPVQWQIATGQGASRSQEVPMVHGTPSMPSNTFPVGGQSFYNVPPSSASPSDAPSQASVQRGQSAQTQPSMAPSNHHPMTPRSKSPHRFQPPHPGATASKMAIVSIMKWTILIAVCTAVAVGGVKALPLILHGSNTTSKATAVSMPPTQTICPADGTARAAVIAPMTLGIHQNIVYFDNERSSNDATGILKRYDVTTGNTTEIIRVAHALILHALISSDGQWLLFSTFISTSQTQGQPELRMVRMDGRGVQTLYCGHISDLTGSNAFNLADSQWSPDQKSVIFTEKKTGTVYLLNMTSGLLQSELHFNPDVKDSVAYYPVAWLDNSHVYVQLSNAMSPFDTNLYMLDVGSRTVQTITYQRGSVLVHIYDNAQIMNTVLVQHYAATLAYPIDIYTTNEFTGTSTDFDRATASHITNPNLIVIAIDTVNKHIAIYGGSSVPASSSIYSDAITSFRDNYNDGDYTNATIAAINSLKSSVGSSVQNPSSFHYALSLDHTQLFVNQCTTSLCSLEVMPAMGGTTQTIFSSPTLALGDVRAVSRTTVLLQVGTPTLTPSIRPNNEDISQNGLWKINIDGTNLTRLTTDNPGETDFFDGYWQSPWSTTSRDGTRYEYKRTVTDEAANTSTYSLRIGSLDGKTSTPITTPTSNVLLGNAGWTAM